MDEIYIGQCKGRLTAALLRQGKLWRCVTASEDNLLDQIYAGRVVKRLSRQAALMNIGLKLPGLLNAPADEAPEGMLLPVQVTKDAREEKGVGLTRDISIAGRYLIFQPHAGRISLSLRHQENIGGHALDFTVLDHLRWSGIVRQAALRVDTATVKKEAEAQLALWRKASHVKQEGLIETSLPPHLALLRDSDGERIKHIIIEDRPTFVEIEKHIRETMPDLAPLLKQAQEKEPLFTVHGIEEALEKGLAPRVPMPEGIHLLFEPGQTLTAIDVNQGSALGYPVDMNKKAAGEIARQIVLRNLGGLIVVDFLRMKTEIEEDQVMEELENALQDDPLRARVLGFTAGGLCEITRPRRGAPLMEMWKNV
ncbi:MAG: ribonuclease E/G [Dongiaceae bacterium]